MQPSRRREDGSKLGTPASLHIYPAEAISIYPGGAEVGAAVLNNAQRCMIFGGTPTVEQYKGNPRVQAHGPGFSKILLADDCVDESKSNCLSTNIKPQVTMFLCRTHLPPRFEDLLIY